MGGNRREQAAESLKSTGSDCVDGPVWTLEKAGFRGPESAKSGVSLEQRGLTCLRSDPRSDTPPELVYINALLVVVFFLFSLSFPFCDVVRDTKKWQMLETSHTDLQISQTCRDGELSHG